MDLLKVHIILPNKPTIPETLSLLKYITKFIFCNVSFLVLFIAIGISWNFRNTLDR